MISAPLFSQCHVANTSRSEQLFGQQGRADTLSRGDLDHGTPVDPSQGRAGQGRAAKKMISVLRHPSFERGPPTHYYMDLLVLIFNVLMGIGVFTRV